MIQDGIQLASKSINSGKINTFRGEQLLVEIAAKLSLGLKMLGAFLFSSEKNPLKPNISFIFLCP